MTISFIAAGHRWLSSLKFVGGEGKEEKKEKKREGDRHGGKEEGTLKNGSEEICCLRT
jgi:hypothetical protein